MNVVLDTSFLIDLMKGDDEAVARLEAMEREEVNASVTSITSFELYYGAMISDIPETEREKVTNAIDGLGLDKLGFGWEGGQDAADIRYELRRSGQQVEIADVFIAAIARENDCSIVTRNTQHFDPIEGVDAIGF